MTTRPLVIAHRGASAEAHENTLPAFARAIEVGADMIELDVRRTRGGELIAFHDADVAGAPVAQLTRRDIAERTGHDAPRLEEVLRLARGRVRVNVELKEDHDVERVLRAVRERAPDEALLTSFLDAVVEQVKRAWAGVHAGLLIDADAPPTDVVARARACGADVLGLDEPIADAPTLDGVRAVGLRVFVWTINDDASLRRHLGDPRVHGVVTDRPGRAIELRDPA